MALKLCVRCGVPLKNDEDVSLTVYAKYVDLKSKIHWSIGKPYDCEQDTLMHRDCPISRND